MKFKLKHKKYCYFAKNLHIKNPSQVPFWPTESCKHILSSTFEFLQPTPNCFLIFLTVSEKFQHNRQKYCNFVRKSLYWKISSPASLGPTESYKPILSSIFVAVQPCENRFFIFLTVPEKFQHMYQKYWFFLRKSSNFANFEGLYLA